MICSGRHVRRGKRRRTGSGWAVIAHAQGASLGRRRWRLRRAVSEEEGGCLLVVVVTGEAAAGSAVTGSPRDMKQQVRRRGAEQRGLEGAWLGRAPGLAGQAEPLLWSGSLSHSSPASLRGTPQALTCAFAVHSPDPLGSTGPGRGRRAPERQSPPS